MCSSAFAAAVVSVPFENGGVGRKGTSTNSVLSIKNYSSLGITQVFFRQESATGQFAAQGNDIPGILRLVKTDGSYIDVPGAINWRGPNGGTILYFGFIPQPTVPSYTLTYNGNPYVIDSGSNYTLVPNTNTYLFVNDQDYTGNAATSGILSALNAYLAASQTNAPLGPVTVNSQVTSDTTPTVTGAVVLKTGETLSVFINGVEYTTSNGLVIDSNTQTWSLILTNPLALGVYSVEAIITNAAGYTLTDSTNSELTIVGNSPGFTVKKTASSTSVPVPEAGTTVLTYTIEAVNTGSMVLDSVSIADTLTGGSTQNLSPTRSGANASDTSFDPGDTWTWTVSYTIQSADIAAGIVENVASVTGTPPGGSPLTIYSGADGVASTSTTVPPAGSGDVTTLGTAGITVTKTASATVIASPVANSTQVTYTITATNSGDMTLGAVSIADTLTGGSTQSLTPTRSGANAGDATFDPGDTWTWDLTYTIQQGDIDAGKISNVAAVTGTPAGGTPLTVYSGVDGTASTSTTPPASGQAVVTVLAPGMSVTKTASSTSVPQPEAGVTQIVYTISAKNTGNTTLDSVTIADTLTGGSTQSLTPTRSGANAGDTSFEPGDTWTWDVTYTIQADDITAGRLENVASVTGTPAGGTPLTIYSGADGVASTSTTAPPPGSGDVTMLGTAGFTVKKSASSTAISAPTAGSTLTYTIEATNTGSVTLSSVSIADTLTGGSTQSLTPARSGSNAGDASFDPGDTWTWQVTYTIQQADITAGRLENVASVTGTPPGGSPLTIYSGADGVASTSTTAPPPGSGDVTTLGTSGFTVKKTASSAAITSPTVGSTLTYTIEATNTGSAMLGSVSIADTLSGGSTQDLTPTRSGSNAGDASFDPGDTWTWQVTYTIQADDIAAGSLENVAAVTGAPAGGAPITIYSGADGAVSTSTTPPPPGSGVVTTLEIPGFTVKKTASSTAISSPRAGTTLTYTIEATNTGSATLGSVSIADTLTGGTTQALTPTRTGSNAGDNSFDPGDTWSWEVSYALQQADIDSGKLENVAAVTASPSGGGPITVYSGENGVASTSGTPPANGSGVVTEIKRTPGDAFEERKDDVRKVLKDLAVDYMTSAIRTNQQMVGSARDRMISAASNCEMVTVDVGLVMKGELTDNDDTQGVSAGDTITYSAVVENTGQVELTNLMVQSDNARVSGLPIVRLAPGKSDVSTFSARHVVTEADIDRGYFEIFASVTGSYSDTGGQVTDVADTGRDGDDRIVIDLGGNVPTLPLTRGAVKDTGPKRVCLEASNSQTAASSASGYKPLGLRGSVYAGVDIKGIDLNAKGDFDGQTGFVNAVNYRVAGSFDVVMNDNDEDVAILNARVMREQMLSQSLMLGVFLGADYVSSRFDDSHGFRGNQSGAVVSGGLYAIKQVNEGLYADAFGSLGYGLNHLNMTTDLSTGYKLDLDSNYDTFMWQLGGSLTGVVEMQSMQFRPNLALAYGNAALGNVGFAAHAYGVSEDVSLEAGNAAVGTLRFTPELYFLLDSGLFSEVDESLSIRPTAVCEYITGSEEGVDCGGGGALSYTAASTSGSRVFSLDLGYEQVSDMRLMSGAVKMSWRL